MVRHSLEVFRQSHQLAQIVEHGVETEAIDEAELPSELATSSVEGL